MPTVPTFEIPKEALPDLKRIAELNEALFNSLLDAFATTDPALTAGQFALKIAHKVPQVGQSDIQAILGITFILYSIRTKSGMSLSPQVLAEGVTNSQLLSKSSVLSPDKKKILSDRIAKLLGFGKSIGVTAKAFDVMTEHERVFCGARILSDIRPIFAESTEAANAAVLIHNLQISFHQDGKHHEFYVALDTNDIQVLKNAIERAEQKTVALQSILKQSNVQNLEVSK